MYYYQIQDVIFQRWLCERRGDMSGVGGGKEGGEVDTANLSSNICSSVDKR